MSRGIVVDGLRSCYDAGDDRLEVLADVSLTVAPNEFVALIGPSGCGKTTLLKTVAGIVEPAAGEIRTDDGRRITGPSADIAMVFQDFVLLPWKSVLENVMLGLRTQANGRDRPPETVAREWIEKVGLEGYEEHYPAELSGGMAQRVGLARALAVDPDVLLMDEPFGSLDAQTKDELQTELLQLWADERKTILFVTHDIDEAIYLADRVLVMSEKPATVVDEMPVGFDRPRWSRRVDIEGSEEFTRLKSALRAELGLTV
jgi:NitT/TauT family transport system ATP-binding protein